MMSKVTVPVPVAPHESVEVKVKVAVVSDRSEIGLVVEVVMVPKVNKIVLTKRILKTSSSLVT